MPVTALLDALAAHLGGRLPGTEVGVTEPSADGDLPAVSMWLPEVTPSLPGTGRIPAPLRTGALTVETTIDLADPVLRFGTETVTLLSPDRRLLQLPHGSIVRADGSDLPPFTTTDVLIRRGATTFTPVTGPPTGNQCRPDPVTGSVLFGTPLPGTGALSVRYFVGAWEVTVGRYAGELRIEAFAASATEVADLSQQVVEALDAPASIPGVHRLDPAALGAIEPADFGNARRRSLSYRFDFEHEVAAIQTGGGPIRIVSVVGGAGPESFTVTREGN